MDPLMNPAFIVFSAVAPMLITLVKQAGLPSWANALIAFIAYIVVGIAGAIMAGEEMTPENAVAFVAVATTVGTVAYNLVWKNLGGEGQPSIEERLTEVTSVIKPSPDGGPSDPQP